MTLLVRNEAPDLVRQVGSTTNATKFFALIVSKGWGGEVGGPGETGLEPGVELVGLRLVEPVIGCIGPAGVLESLRQIRLRDTDDFMNMLRCDSETCRCATPRRAPMRKSRISASSSKSPARPRRC